MFSPALTRWFRGDFEQGGAHGVNILHSPRPMPALKAMGMNLEKDSKRFVG